MKNVIVRTAHLKELMGEKTWKVTPRSVRPGPSGPPDGIERRDPTSRGAALRGDDVPAGAPYVAPIVVAPDPIVVTKSALPKARRTRAGRGFGRRQGVTFRSGYVAAMTDSDEWRGELRQTRR